MGILQIMGILGAFLERLAGAVGEPGMGAAIRANLDDLGQGITTAVAGMTAGQLAATTALPALAASNPVSISPAELCTPSIQAFSSSVAQQLPAPQRSEGMSRGRA